VVSLPAWVDAVVLQCAWVDEMGGDYACALAECYSTL